MYLEDNFAIKKNAKTVEMLDQVMKICLIFH